MIKEKSKILYRITAVMLIVLLTGNLTFAAAISDVSSSHWAITDIDNMVTNQIMDLYEDGSFKSEDSATKIEAVIVIYRAALAAGLVTTSEADTLATKYDNQLSNLSIPRTFEPYGTDVYRALGYALENEIVVLDEVKYFIDGSTFTSLSKIDASVFFGKALNLYKNENLNKIISLTYKDASEISFSAMKYVNLLIEYGIVSKSGDSEGRFNPKMILNRAILAVFVDGLYGEISTGQVTLPDTSGDETDTTDGTETDETDTTAVETDTLVDQEISGVVTNVFADLEYLEVKDADGAIATYDVSDSVFYTDGILIDIDMLKAELQVTLTIEDGVVVRVDTTEAFDKGVGTFNKLSDYLGSNKDFRSLSYAVSTGGFNYIRVYDDTVVRLDGEDAKIEDLSSNDYLNIYYEGYTAKLIVAYSSNYVFKGFVNETVDADDFETISITLEDGTKIEAEPSTRLSASGFSGGAAKENDIVEVTLAYGKVRQLKYLSSIRDITGIIKGINIMSTSEVSIDTGASKYETYTIPADVDILGEDGETVLDIYDLRLEQFINIHIGFNGIESIELGQKADEEGFELTVTSLFTSSNLIIGVDEDGVTKTIALNTNADLDIDDYAVGDVLNIIGTKITNTLYEAESITIK